MGPLLRPMPLRQEESALMRFFSSAPTQPTYSQVNYYVLWLCHLPVGKQKSSYTSQLARSFITKSLPSLNQLRPLAHPLVQNLFKGSDWNSMSTFIRVQESQMKEDIIHCLYFPLFVLEHVSARPNNGMKRCEPCGQVEKIPPSQTEEGKKSFKCIKNLFILSELHDHSVFFLKFSCMSSS